jgi:hypothetical protein
LYVTTTFPPETSGASTLFAHETTKLLAPVVEGAVIVTVLSPLSLRGVRGVPGVEPCPGHWVPSSAQLDGTGPIEAFVALSEPPLGTVDAASENVRFTVWPLSAWLLPLHSSLKLVLRRQDRSGRHRPEIDRCLIARAHDVPVGRDLVCKGHTDEHSCHDGSDQTDEDGERSSAAV